MYSDHKAGEIAGNVVMVKQLRELHLMLHLLQLLTAQELKVDQTNSVEKVCWLVLRYEDPGKTIESNTCICNTLYISIKC